MRHPTYRNHLALTLMTTLGAAACVGGQESGLGLASQSIVPGIGTTCAAGSFEGDTTPDRNPGAPWALVEGLPLGGVASRGGQFVASLAGLGGVAYTRVEPRAVGATQLTMDANVAVSADPVAPALGCPTVPVANLGLVVSDGARMAGLAVGRMRNPAGVEVTYVAIRALDRCATPVAIVPFDFDIREFHVYSLRLDRTGASVYIDKDPTPVVQAAYDRLDVAAPMNGAHLGIRSERANVTWDYVRYSACGPATSVPVPPVSACGGACVGNRAPSCALAAASQPSLWPPNHSFRPERVLGITDADGDEVAYTVDYVTSDEPGDAQGDNDNGDDVGVDDQDTNDDGSLHAAGSRQTHGHGALLRAERSDAGNGRVYSMHVTANDGRGGSCQTTVRVCVPHDHSTDPCVDDGQNYVITAPPPPPPPVPVAPGTLRCPAPSSALAGSPVSLTATGAAAATRVRWSVSTAPSSTRAYNFASTYSDSGAMVATGTTTPFTSVIVGDFTVHVEATYPNGTVDQCDTTVSMLGHGLRVELSWNT
ncbi:MAG: uncharacterized protein JWM10_2759, partial [Myxococcaceae bacterium]|nr:uncharacterized protein [Myxococcaceae bacterium]